jgi:SAM-dependent methyltransferase
MKNIVYQSSEIARYFAHNRVKWQQFYESERRIIEQLHLGSEHTVLDIGCGCGGLGMALRDQFGIRDYTGVEINKLAADAARTLNPQAKILFGDILELSGNALRGKRFDAVFSLSCVDWNVRFSDMLIAAWNQVAPGGHLVSTFRLTVEEGCGDIERSHQFINSEGTLKGERACYVVLNAKSLMEELGRFDPSRINAYGYWGAPSGTAVTPYERLCFAAFSVRKRKPDDVVPLFRHLDLPAEILEAVGL